MYNVSRNNKQPCDNINISNGWFVERWGWHWCLTTFPQVMQTLQLLCNLWLTCNPVIKRKRKKRSRPRDGSCNFRIPPPLMASWVHQPPSSTQPIQHHTYIFITEHRKVLTDGKRHQRVREHRVGFYQIFSHLWVKEKTAKMNTGSSDTNNPP